MADMDVQIAVLETKVEALTREVTKLTASVDALMALMNRGKGAFAVSIVLAGAIGAAVMKAVAYLLSLGQPGS